MLDIKLLEELSQAPGVPGYENEIRNLVKTKLTPLVDEVTVDRMGSVLGIKRSGKPNAPKLQIAAHIDEIGFIVNQIDDQGFLRFLPLGGFDPKTLSSMRVAVHGKERLIGCMGSKAVHMMSPEERKKMPKVEDFYIDLGLGKEEVEALVPIGSTVTRWQPMIEMGKCLNGKSFDNRSSVFVLLEMLRQIGDHEADIYASFTVQEEVGLRGATVAAHAQSPDFALALDVTIANDTPGERAQDLVCKLGSGAAIKVLDAGVICDQRMVAFLRQTADANEIPWQHEFMTKGGTDTASLQRSGKHGAIAGALSIPLRYMHQTIETIHRDDLEAVIRLLTKASEEITNYNWDYA